MNIFHEVVNYAVSSVAIGAIVAILIVAAIYFLIMRAKNADQVSPVGYVFAVIFVVLLGWQSIKIIGGLNLKSKCTDIIEFIDQNINQDTINQSTIVQALSSEVPLAESLIDQVQPTAESIKTAVEQFKKDLTTMIWKAVAWAVIIIAISIFVIPRTLEQTAVRGRDRRNLTAKSNTRYRRRR